MFDALIGNHQTKSVLRRLIENDRFPQSSIFVGKDGIGKKRFALEIAKGFVCPISADFEACGTCSACTRAEKFNLATSGKKEDYEQVFFSDHPDIGLVIPNKQTIYINAIRDLEREANFRPYEAKARFLIIDEAEKMPAGASNALLKTLEEPPETAFIFLITSHPASLLPTIHSRCQTIRFSPIAKNEIEQYLFEENDYSSKDAKLIAGLSRGSMGNALRINLDSFREKRAQMFEVLATLSEGGHYTSLLRTAEEINRSKDKEDFEDYVSTLQTLVHDIWKLANDQTAEITNIDVADQIKKFSVPIPRLAKWLEEIENLRENLRSNLNRKIATNALFMKMAG